MREEEKAEIDKEFLDSLERIAGQEQTANRRQADLAEAAEVYFSAREKDGKDSGAEALAEHLRKVRDSRSR